MVKSIIKTKTIGRKIMNKNYSFNRCQLIAGIKELEKEHAITPKVDWDNDDNLELETYKNYLLNSPFTALPDEKREGHVWN